MKYMFVIQGEGRGHFTQALSLKKMLERNGHEVVSVMVGCSKKRRIPDFFSSKVSGEIIRFQSPNFLPAPQCKRSSILLSVLYNLLLIPSFIASLFLIRKTIRETEPDVVVNFYELMCGLTYGIFNPQVPMINIAHQYYFMTQNFRYTGENVLRFRLLNFYSWCTSIRSYKRLALSFRKEDLKEDNNIRIVPPLLRDEVFDTIPGRGSYIHGYLLNTAFADELQMWSDSNLSQPLHFFWDNKNAPAVEMLTPLLAMHQLNDQLFLQYMAGCKAYATTGGFESVCEAMYMKKPVLMVPTHIEQECNVIDAMKSGAGVGAYRFDIDILLEFLPDYRQSNEFRNWAHKAEQVILNELTNIEYHLTPVFVLA
jgi:Glycosyl transferases, related to UDP-glucuronosyltransferase